MSSRGRRHYVRGPSRHCGDAADALERQASGRRKGPLEPWQRDGEKAGERCGNAQCRAGSGERRRRPTVRRQVGGDQERQRAPRVERRSGPPRLGRADEGGARPRDQAASGRRARVQDLLIHWLRPTAIRCRSRTGSASDVTTSSPGTSSRSMSASSEWRSGPASLPRGFPTSGRMTRHLIDCRICYLPNGQLA